MKNFIKECKALRGQAYHTGKSYRTKGQTPNGHIARVSTTTTFALTECCSCTRPGHSAWPQRHVWELRSKTGVVSSFEHRWARSLVCRAIIGENSVCEDSNSVRQCACCERQQGVRRHPSHSGHTYAELKQVEQSRQFRLLLLFPTSPHFNLLSEYSWTHIT